MFAIFLHESMNPFYQTITSFPTVIYTALLIFCLFYWLIAMLGVVDIDFLDLDLDGDIDISEGADAQHALAGLLLKLGLYGVPLTIILTILSLIAWIICYYSTYYLAPILGASILIKYAAGALIFVIATYIAALITGQIIKPIRTFFEKLEVNEIKHVLGQTVVVRSAIVNKEKGEAFMNDGGAGLLLNIRATGSDQFKKGDEVVLIEQISEKNIYRVIAKSEFSG